MKFKSIKITEKTHKILKDFCKKNNLKINSWVESLILEKMEKAHGKNISTKLSKM